MPDKWMTVAAAAATLNVHPRTIERRIASGRIESRRTDDGQLQVLINAPDDAPASAEALETVKELAQDQVSLATGSASALVKFAQQDADRARGELDLVRQDAGAPDKRPNGVDFGRRDGGRSLRGGGVDVYKLTRTQDDLRTLNEQAAAVRQDADAMRHERDAALREAEEAKIARAQTAGHLEAVSDKLAKSDARPTTRPTNVIQRVVSLFSEP